MTDEWTIRRLESRLELLVGLYPTLQADAAAWADMLFARTEVDLAFSRAFPHPLHVARVEDESRLVLAALRRMVGRSLMKPVPNKRYQATR